MTKTCPICGKPAPGMRKYCGDACALENKRERARSYNKEQRQKAKSQGPRTRRVMEDSIRTQERICLRCDKPFKSHGPHNRICPKCYEINRQWLAGVWSEKIMFVAKLLEP